VIYEKFYLESWRNASVFCYWAKFPNDVIVIGAPEGLKHQGGIGFYQNVGAQLVFGRSFGITDKISCSVVKPQGCGEQAESEQTKKNGLLLSEDRRYGW
jgi:hypothetical protein